MAKMVWQPGDPVGGPQKAYLTPGGKITTPVRKMPGGAILFRDGAGNLYRRDELVLTEVKPEKRLPQSGRKKVR